MGRGRAGASWGSRRSWPAFVMLASRAGLVPLLVLGLWEQAQADDGAPTGDDAEVTPRSPAPSVGADRSALPGIIHVPVALREEPPGVVLSASAGYGYTEAVLGRGDRHGRVTGTLAASVAPLDWLAIGLRLDGRYDHNTDPLTGSSGGTVGDPRLVVRASGDAGHGFHLGGQLGLWFPGDRAPSLVLSATTLDALALASFVPEGSPVVFAAHAGVRLDNSAQSAPDAARLTPSDRVSLGLNDASAILTGLGLSVHASPRVEVLVDASADWLFGSRAPTLFDSPIRAGLGGRYRATRDGILELQLLFEGSPSGRPPLDPASPLVSIEPRFAVSLGITVRPGGDGRAPARPAPAPEPASEVVAPTMGPAHPVPARPVAGKVVGEGGAPLAGAQLLLRPHEGAPRSGESDDQGHFELGVLPPGPATLEVQATGYQKAIRDLNVTPDDASALTIALDRALPSAQIRGTVHDFTGRAVVATISVEPVAGAASTGASAPPVSATAQANGGFELDVAPGTYDVVITAKGFARQRRRVVVERDGVTVLNVDLRSGS